MVELHLINPQYIRIWWDTMVAEILQHNKHTVVLRMVVTLVLVLLGSGSLLRGLPRRRDNAVSVGKCPACGVAGAAGFSKGVNGGKSGVGEGRAVAGSSCAGLGGGFIAKASSPKASRSCSVAACTASPLRGSSLFWTCLGPRAPKPHSQGTMSTCPTPLRSHGEGSRLTDVVMKMPPEESTMRASFKVVFPTHTPRCQESKPFVSGTHRTCVPCQCILDRRTSQMQFRHEPLQTDCEASKHATSPTSKPDAPLRTGHAPLNLPCVHLKIGLIDQHKVGKNGW